MFIYEMMQMYCARGGQTVFSSVQLSPGVPKIWRDRPAVYAGAVRRQRRVTVEGIVTPDNGERYGDFEREVRLAFKALMEVMIEGDAKGKLFSFPKPEIAIEPCFIDLDPWVQKFDLTNHDLPTYDELYRLAFQLAAKFGTPYFDNMLPAYRGSGEGISCYQCCAYSFNVSAQSDSRFKDKMNFVDGEHFSMGSWMVISLNCPRAGYRNKLYGVDPVENLKHLMDKAVEVFAVKRDWMNHLIEDGRIPFAIQRPDDPNDPDKLAPCAVGLDKFVYTIGVIGIDDLVKTVMGRRMHENKQSLQYGLWIIYELKQYAKELSEKTGMEIALARTPAETTAQRFAVSDLRSNKFRDLAGDVVQGDITYALRHLTESDLPVYYTNGTHVPPAAHVGLADRLNIESKFFPLLDGGNIAHIWLGEAWTSPEGLYEFGMNLAQNTHIGYFSFTKDFTICNDCGEISPGLKEACPVCKSDSIDFISRITGYLSNVSGWNNAKKQELIDRKRVNL